MHRLKIRQKINDRRTIFLFSFWPLSTKKNFQNSYNPQSITYLQNKIIMSFGVASVEFTAVFESAGIAQKLFTELSDPDTTIIQGSILSQSGLLYRPEDVAIVDTVGNFGGGVQPFVASFAQIEGTIDGQCTATSVDEETGTILAHSCFINICPEFDTCINIYSGSPFVYTPGFNQNELPPSYPGTIIGGTGFLSGIEGSVEVITVAGRDASPTSSTGAIAQRIFLDFARTGVGAAAGAIEDQWPSRS